MRTYSIGIVKTGERDDFVEFTPGEMMLAAEVHSPVVRARGSFKDKAFALPRLTPRGDHVKWDLVQDEDGVVLAVPTREVAE